MKLANWLNKKRISNIDFAKKINVHFSYITHINKGRRIPSPDIALKIEKATGGKVTVLELLYPDRKAA